MTSLNWPKSCCISVAHHGRMELAPMAFYLHAAAGSWTPVFALAIAADFTTAALALLALRPMRARLLAHA